MVRTLLIDNYDSYTYNLYQLLSEVNGEPPMVYTNDKITIEDIKGLLQRGEVHNIVISPGPGTPEHAGDVGVCLEVFKQLPDVPVLGVCLGHQALAHAHGGRVVTAPEPVHGRISELQHTGHPLFDGVPNGPGQGFGVVRYHSLVVDWPTLPSCLQPIAWTCGGHHAVTLGTEQVTPSAPNAAPDTQHAVDAQACVKAPAVEAACNDSCAHANGQMDSQQQPCQSHRSTNGTSGPTLLEEQQQQQQQHGEGASPAPLLMALAHSSRPHYGVQFHPESVSTSYGAAVLQNFRDLSCRHLGTKAPRSSINLVGPPGRAFDPHPWPSLDQGQGQGAKLALTWQCLRGVLQAAGGTEGLFDLLFGWQAHTWWLDSAAADRGRFSYMGGRGGPLWQRLTFKLNHPSSQQQHQHQQQQAEQQHQQQQQTPSGVLEVEDSSGQVHHLPTSFLTHLDQLLRNHRISVPPAAAEQLPFNFWGGLVGYLGYELKSECGGRSAHVASTPDAAMYLTDRLVAVDHQQGDVYILAMYEVQQAAQNGHAGSTVPSSTGSAGVTAGVYCNGGTIPAVQPSAAEAVNGCSSSSSSSAIGSKGTCNGCTSTSSNTSTPQGQAEHWVANTCQQITKRLHSRGFTSNGDAAGTPAPAAVAADFTRPSSTSSTAAAFQLRHAREQYIHNIAECNRALHMGDSYEVCLTTALVRRGAPDAVQLYRTLRKLNAAPYAAWLNFGHSGPVVCCSSPERFLRGDRGGVLEARPIKGTAPRHISDPAADQRAADELAASEKDRAENLMIVDLLRNDLGRVCEVGSVHVPGLMEIESYATVHQMVSTVQGLRCRDASVVDCIRAAFPGGSMTGAPKIRTMEIIDQLEGGARGIYSGSIGFISFNDTFDLNIVIRTAVIENDVSSSAAGGDCNGQQPRQQAMSAGMPSGTSASASSLITIGAGGAIVVQSDPEAEYEEMRLKARALMAAVGRCDGGEGGLPAQVDDAVAWGVKE